MQESRQQKIERLTAEAMRKLATRTTADLINICEILDNMINATKSKQKRSELLLTSRWAYDELERRDPEAFNAFLDSDDESPRAYFLA